MNAIQKISQDLLRERGGTPFNPIGQLPQQATPPRRQISEVQARRHEESRRLMHRLAGFAG